MLECTTPGSELTLWLTEHYFMGPTYQMGLDGELEGIRKTIGFYNGNSR